MKKIIIVSILAAVGAFLWWTISPLFIDVVLDDAMPTESESEILRNDVYEITDTSTHPATGSVRVTTSESGSTIRYENYNGTNGPDLKIYLTNDLDAADFIDLGRAQANQGNINYPVPEDVDVEDYRYVVTWCEAFGVLFDYAEIR
ncbi:DM13 domain-containing protein [Candidatus Pacebacteria bacterium]|nr:DM13 domain-containing protein [Candidatus Paceibacterota bacterium]